MLLDVPRLLKVRNRYEVFIVRIRICKFSISNSCLWLIKNKDFLLVIWWIFLFSVLFIYLILVCNFQALLQNKLAHHSSVIKSIRRYAAIAWITQRYLTGPDSVHWCANQRMHTLDSFRLSKQISYLWCNHQFWTRTDDFRNVFKRTRRRYRIWTLTQRSGYFFKTKGVCSARAVFKRKSKFLTKSSYLLIARRALSTKCWEHAPGTTTNPCLWNVHIKSFVIKATCTLCYEKK